MHSSPLPPPSPRFFRQADPGREGSSARVREGAAQEEAERRYEDALERMQLLAIAEDCQGTITYCNPCAAQVLGWPAEELIGRSVFETLVPPEHREKKRADYLAMMAMTPSGIPQSYEAENLTRTGERRRIRWNVSELRGRDGLIEGVMCFGHDLTTEIQAATESAEARALVEALLAGTPDLMFLFDAEMRYLQIHAKPELMVRPVEELLGRRFLEVSDSAYAAEAKRLFDRALATHEVQVLEYPLEVPAGLRHFEARLVHCGEQRGLAIVRDITERRGLEAQLLQAQKMEAIGQLAGGIAHDFNNLLTVMLGGLDLIRLDSGHCDRPLLDLATESARRAADLTQQLLDYARQGPLAVEDFDLTVVLQETARLLARTFEPRHGLVLQLPAEPVLVCGDPRKIRQVVMNLCLNARDAIAAHGTVTLTAGTRAATDLTLPPHAAEGVQRFGWFAVTDDGIGMAPAVRARMFDPFFTTKERGKGTGLGLAMVLGVTEQHAGWVECDSTPGKGSEFRVFLPAGSASAEGRPASPRRLEQIEPRHVTCLLVDDEPHVLLTARLMLERDGFEVLAASSAEQALELLAARRGSVDVVLLDLMMPSLGGAEAVSRLRACDPDVRMVLMSGGLLAEDERPPGADGWLAKPFRRQELVAAVLAILGSDRPHRGAV